MKKVIKQILTTTSLLALTINLNAVNARTDEVIVVANVDSDVSLTRQEVKSLFMGGVVVDDLKPIALPANNPARVVFNTKVLGLTETRVQSYWAQMRFTGRKKPPIEVQDQLALIEYLIETPNSVGYLPVDADIPEGLKVVYEPVKN